MITSVLIEEEEENLFMICIFAIKVEKQKAFMDRKFSMKNAKRVARNEARFRDGKLKTF